MTTRYLLGLDLGQAVDYSALAVAERTQPAAAPASYAIRRLQRWPLHTRYAQVVDDVHALVSAPPLAGNATLVLDKTGVGAGVVELFVKAALPCPIVAVSIHGGDTVTEEDPASTPHRGVRSLRVPKRDLVTAVSIALQTQRLAVAAALPEAATLREEMQQFHVKIDPQTAHDSYASWRERQHDDLVLAVALALWEGERRPAHAPGVLLHGAARGGWYRTGPRRDVRVISTSIDGGPPETRLFPHGWGS